MGRGWAIVTCLVLLAGQTAAAPLDKARLRALPKFPVPALNTSLMFNEAYGFYLGWTKPDELTEIGNLKRALRHDASDAALHRQIGKLYQSLQMGEPARENFGLAAKLYFQQIQAQPGDGWLRAQYADAWSETADRKRRAEAEPVFRQAAELTPADWRGWALFGDYLLRTLKDRFVDDPTPDRRDPKVRQAEIDKLFAESRDCYVRAVAAAPRDPQVYAARAFARSQTAQIMGVLRMRHGERINFYAEVFSPECIEDLKTAARLKNDARSIGIAALGEVLSVRLRQELANVSPQDLWKRLPEATQQSLEAARAALEKLGQATDPQQAAEALEMLGLVQATVWADDARAEVAFREAVKKDHGRESAWHLLLITASRRGGPFVPICLERLKLKDSPVYHLHLARVYERSQYTGSVEEEIKAALAAGPRDFDANLAQAIYVLKYADPDRLPSAMTYLSRASEVLRESPTQLRRAQLAAAQGFYVALTGNPAEARLRLKEALALDAMNEPVREALELLGN
jgi:tetratricopeptide (TPR) repeat protein